MYAIMQVCAGAVNEIKKARKSNLLFDAIEWLVSRIYSTSGVGWSRVFNKMFN